MNLPEKKMTRREMLRFAGWAGLGGLAAITLPRGATAAESTAHPALPQVPRRVLGKTGQTIPILLMGGGMGFDPKFDPRLPECMRFGVNYFDVADCYAGGGAEIGLGNFVEKSGLRNKMWITTKSDAQDPVGMVKILDRSLERLKTDHVDLFFLHGLKDPKFLVPELGQASEKLRKEGKIRFFGFSCHDSTVPELLTKAASFPWIDAIMFKYNFRDFGDKTLNDAMDACHQANIGLIAMKTQGSAISFTDRVKKFEGGKFSHHQAVLKAVWDDPRITAAVSHMDTLEKLKANIAVALDRDKLTAADHAALQQYAQETRHLYCAGCQHICGQALPAGIEVGTALRCLMYHDTYGDVAKAREVFSQLPAVARRINGVDFTRAAALCPHQIDIAQHMRRAVEVLA